LSMRFEFNNSPQTLWLLWQEDRQNKQGKALILSLQFRNKK